MNRLGHTHRTHAFTPWLRALLMLATVACWPAAAHADPSGRVAYVGDAQGEVSYSPAGEDDWLQLVRNRPVIPGDRLWTDRNARVELQVGGAVIRLAASTSMELLELDDDLAQLEVTEGTLYLRIEHLYAGQAYEVATPDMVFSFDRAGRYRIDVNPESGVTTVIVREGHGEVSAEDSHFPLRAGDAVQFYGADLRDNEFVDVPRNDAFDRYCSNRDRSLERSLSRRYMSDDVAGASQLDDYGDWRPAGGFGMAWFPRNVRADWAPYRDGHWAWQEPWGWTWVDDARWGFAPSHYGRWVHAANRWGWVPGPRNLRPVYSPALVVFIGGRGASHGGGGVTVGWFPLAVRDVYVPSYRVSREYFRRVNVGSTVVDSNRINNAYGTYERNLRQGNSRIEDGNYANRRVNGAVTAVPRNVFVESRPVRQAAIRLDRRQVDEGAADRLAPVAPIARSVRGAGQPAQVRPPRAALERRVVVRTPPRAATRPFAERQAALQARPGQAPAQDAATSTPSAAAGPAAPAARAAAAGRNVRVLPHAAVDARAAGPRRKPRGTAPPASTRPQGAEPASAPTPGSAPTPAPATAPAPGQAPARPTSPPAADAPAARAHPGNDGTNAGGPAARTTARARAEANAKARADAAAAKAERARNHRGRPPARNDEGPGEPDSSDARPMAP